MLVIQKVSGFLVQEPNSLTGSPQINGLVVNTRFITFYYLAHDPYIALLTEHEIYSTEIRAKQMKITRHQNMG
jgi:hypothetical protein